MRGCFRVLAAGGRRQTSIATNGNDGPGSINHKGIQPSSTARDYALPGWNVLPLHTARDCVCSCCEGADNKAGGECNGKCDKKN